MAIPENHPKHPRWLLNLHEWKTVPYTDVPKDVLDGEGYGIVSYTWGNMIDKAKTAEDPPKGLLWNVPAVKKWPLSKAREVMNKIGTTYVWWDWMCVPQHGDKPLSDELQKAQCEEIAKQRYIYQAASKSIVWLHSISWSDDSALKDLIKLHPEYTEAKDVALLQKEIDNAIATYNKAWSENYWLRSGWAYQEGVLLPKTILIDTEGNILSGPEFSVADHATVSGLTNPIMHISQQLAAGYFIKSQGHEPDTGLPCPDSAHLLSQAPNDWLCFSLKVMLWSGLAYPLKNSPLHTLAGRANRKFGVKQDGCWGLVRILGLTNIEITYDEEDFLMEQTKARFFRALIDMYQWEILMMGFPGDSQFASEGFKWEDVLSGIMLPVHAFAVEIRDASGSTQVDLPVLNYTNGIHIKGRNGKKVTLYRPTDEEKKWFRHYRQDDDGLKIISNRETTFEQDTILSSSWLVPLHHINMKAGVPGIRCVALIFKRPELSDAPACFAFGGVIDIKGVWGESIVFKELVLDPSPPVPNPNNSHTPEAHDHDVPEAPDQ
ncbi:hypothetical protein HG530_007058 [Fusarium avenaceum]|nr:hypothetical protein HG530_007058 [Fusarium avenaceum]